LDAAIPTAAELAGVCTEVVREWHRREPPLEWSVVSASFFGAEDGWMDAMARLCVINCFQWHLEDECRAHYADSDRLAALKREIDASNGRRVRCIDELDERLIDELGQPDGEPEQVALITPGNLLDRISILTLKREHATHRLAVVAGLAEQLDDACRGLDELVSDVACARQRIKRYPTVKLYGAAE
jgi:hypothetical protein